jgi:hypothetical protein
MEQPEPVPEPPKEQTPPPASPRGEKRDAPEDANANADANVDADADPFAAIAVAASPARPSKKSKPDESAAAPEAEPAIDVSKLKVAELRAELEKRGEPTNGLKAVLAKRLTKVLAGKK